MISAPLHPPQVDFENDPHLAVSSIKLLMLFQKWLLRASHFPVKGRWVPIVFLAHFQRLGLQALPALLTLEKWIQDKMKDFIHRECKHLIFRQWRATSGVDISGRLHHQRRLLRAGVDAWMEHNVRLHMKRKSSLQIYAQRRFALSGCKGLSRWEEIFDEELGDDSTALSSPVYRSDKLLLGRMCYHKAADFVGCHTGMTASHSTSKTMGHSKLYRQFENFQSPDELELSASSSPIRLRHRSDKLLLGIVPVRHVIENSQTVYRALLRQDDGHSPFLLNAMQSSSCGKQQGQQHYGSTLQQAEYQASQDLIALFFVFQRFRSRSSYRKKAKLIIRSSQQKILLSSWEVMFKAWKGSNQARKLHEHKAIEKNISIMFRRMERAFYKILDNVSKCRQERREVATLREKILMRPTCIQALYMLNIPVYIRCFMHWKENSEINGISKVMNVLAHTTFRNNGWKRFFNRWRGHCYEQSKRRKTGMSRHENIFYAAYQSQISLPKVISQISITDYLEEDMFCSRKVVARAVELASMFRALHRLKRQVQRPKLFSSFLEMKLFYHFSSHLSICWEDRQKVKLLTQKMYARVVHSNGENSLMKLIIYDKDKHSMNIISVPVLALRASVADDLTETALTNASSMQSIVDRRVSRFLLITAQRFQEVYDKHIKLSQATGMLSPRKGPVPVNEYLNSIGKKTVQELRGYVSIPSGVLSAYMKKWHRFHATVRHIQALEKAVKQGTMHNRLHSIWMKWKEVFHTISNWRRYRLKKGLKCVIQYATVSHIIKRAQRIVVRALCATSVRRLHSYARQGMQARYQGAAYFCNQILHGLKGRFHFFILHAHHRAVPFEMHKFLSTCPSFRFEESIKSSSPRQLSVKPTIVRLTHKHKHIKVTAMALAAHLAQALSAYRGLRVAFQVLRTRTRRQSIAQEKLREYRIRKLETAFIRLRRHRYCGRLRKQVRFGRLHVLMLMWKASLRQLCARRNRLRYCLTGWRTCYLKSMYARVWERAWGIKLRNAWSYWTIYCSCQEQRIAKIQQIRIKCLQKYVWKQWISLYRGCVAYQRYLLHGAIRQWHDRARVVSQLGNQHAQAGFVHHLRLFQYWKMVTQHSSMQLMDLFLAKEWFERVSIIKVLGKLNARFANLGQVQGYKQAMQQGFDAHRVRHMERIHSTFLPREDAMKEFGQRYERMQALLAEEEVVSRYSRYRHDERNDQSKSKASSALQQSVQRERSTFSQSREDLDWDSRSDAISTLCRSSLHQKSSCRIINNVTSTNAFSTPGDSIRISLIDIAGQHASSRSAHASSSTNMTRSLRVHESLDPMDALVVDQPDSVRSNRSMRSALTVSFQDKERDLSRASHHISPRPAISLRSPYTPRLAEGSEAFWCKRAVKNDAERISPLRERTQQLQLVASSVASPGLGCLDLASPRSAISPIRSPVRSSHRPSSTRSASSIGRSPYSVDDSSSCRRGLFLPQRQQRSSILPEASRMATDSVQSRGSYFIDSSGLSRQEPRRALHILDPHLDCQQQPEIGSSSAAAHGDPGSAMATPHVHSWANALSMSMRPDDEEPRRYAGSSNMPSSSVSGVSPRGRGIAFVDPHRKGLSSTSHFESPLRGSMYSRSSVRSVSSAMEAQLRRGLYHWHRRSVRSVQNPLLTYFKRSAAARRSFRRLYRYSIQSSQRRFQYCQLQCQTFLRRWINRINYQRSMLKTLQFVKHFHLIITMKCKFKTWRVHTKHRLQYGELALLKAEELRQIRQLALAFFQLKVPVDGSVRAYAASVMSATIDSGQTDHSSLTSAADYDPQDGLAYYRNQAAYKESTVRRNDKAASSKQVRYAAKRQLAPDSRKKKASKDQAYAMAYLRTTANQMVFQATKKLLFSRK
jgi:hypothetical protein